MIPPRRTLLLTWLLLLVACPKPGPDNPISLPGVEVLPQDLVPFTTALREEFQLTADDLKLVQFYVSDEITLQATRVSGQTAVAGGTLRKIGATLVEEVLIKSLTPCLARETLDNELRVSFNAELPNHLLAFGDDGKSGGRYVLFARRWEGDVGHLVYGGDDFAAVAHSDRAHLLVRKDLKETLKKNRRVEPGVRLPIGELSELTDRLEQTAQLADCSVRTMERASDAEQRRAGGSRRGGSRKVALLARVATTSTDRRRHRSCGR